MREGQLLTQYNIVSLGYFCGPAQELERCGLRDSSFPFDWLITSSFEIVLEQIKNSFHGFLTMEYFQQSISHREHYYNSKTKMWFYHDFSKYTPLEDQMKAVIKKYDRRIKRFYKTIERPTIFIRYVSDEKEAAYINCNEEKIKCFLKSYCCENQIVYIYNEDLDVRVKDAYSVKKDNRDVVARSFLKQLPELERVLGENYNKKNQIESNKHRYTISQRRKRSLIRRCIRELQCFVKNEYHHYNEYQYNKET